MPVMYKTHFVPPRITKHQVPKSTAHTVTYYIGTNARCTTERKLTTYYAWLETFEDAKAALLTYWQKEVEQTTRIARRCRDYLEEVEGVTEPSEP